MQDHSLQQHKHNWADRSLELPRNVPKSQLPYCCSLLSHIKHWPKICLCICYHIIYYRSATQRQTQNLKQSVCRATNYGCNCNTMRGLDLGALLHQWGHWQKDRGVRIIWWQLHRCAGQWHPLKGCRGHLLTPALSVPSHIVNSTTDPRPLCWKGARSFPLPLFSTFRN